MTERDPTTAHHRVTKVPMDEGMAALVLHMDELAQEGWEPFHLHESLLSQAPCFLVFSRRMQEPYADEIVRSDSDV